MAGLRTCAAALCAAILLPCAAPVAALAQFAAPSYVPGGPNPATGERYNVEASAGMWFPTVSAIVSSESLGLIGSEIDLVNDLGVVNQDFTDFRLVLRPGRKHKLRFQFTPIKYETEATIGRDLVFNGIVFPIRLKVTSLLEWKAWRFGYEYDFIYRDRGFLGLILEAKYTDVRVELTNPLTTEFSEASAPIPAVGLIGRGYLARNLSITGEFTGFKLPGDVLEDEGSGEYYEGDVYATLNFTNNVGVQGGYRALSVKYRIDQDYGDLKLDGFYLTGVVRF